MQSADRSRKRRSRLLLMGFGLLSILLLHASTSAGVETPSRNAVIAFCAFPNSSHQRFVEVMRNTVENKAVDGLEFRLVTTMGDKETMRNALSETGSERLLAVVYLDVQSAWLLADEVGCPTITLALCRSMLSRPEAAPGSAADALCCSATSTPTMEERATMILETGPRARHLVAAADALVPAPTATGIIYTGNDPWNEEFMADLRVLWKKRFGDRILLTELPLSAAACRNSNAIRSAIEKAFAHLDAGAVLVVLRGQNTLKFPFLFRNYAREHNFGLVTVGGFPATQAIVDIQYPQDSLAMRCLNMVARFRDSGSTVCSEDSLFGPHISFDEEIMRDLGYTRKVGSPDDAVMQEAPQQDGPAQLNGL